MEGDRVCDFYGKKKNVSHFPGSTSLNDESNPMIAI